MWYYTTGGPPQGPMDDAALDQLIANGTVTANSLIWKEGMEQWAPLGQVRTLPPGADPASTTCTMCGKNVGADNLIDLLGHRVCAACKPLVVQSLREGAKPAGAYAISAWREAKKVVTYDQMVLPPRCFKCNHPVDTPPMKRKLFWHHPIFYALIISPIIYIIIAILIRKRATVDLYLCSEHSRRRKNFIVGSWSGAGLGFAMIVIGAVASLGWLAGLGVLAIMVAICVGLIGAALCRATRIKGNTVWIGGAGREFLESLQPWNGD